LVFLPLLFFFFLLLFATNVFFFPAEEEDLDDEDGVVARCDPVFVSAVTSSSVEALFLGSLIALRRISLWFLSSFALPAAIGKSIRPPPPPPETKEEDAVVLIFSPRKASG
jgi:hypothetical protein